VDGDAYVLSYLGCWVSLSLDLISYICNMRVKKRDYKAEYKKYGSPKKAKLYRAELNRYNHKKKTYGNGDGLDAAHEGGKIRGFLKSSKNKANNRPKKRSSV